jgi:glycerol-3-phosphate O-acyltransferase/dihydroxyacetone phosphate acyltransferase
MVLKAFLDLVYLLLKQLVLLYQRIYYPFTVVRQRQRLNLPGGGIIISNHPNTMTDPLHIVSRSRRQVFFLANASLFKHPIANFLLNHLYCIPVSRPGRDTKGPPISLEESFARSFDHLAGGNVLYIAPEGTSFLERRLRPFKTGTARIALGAEAAHDFQLGLTIVPAGLNYEHPKDCGSRLFIDVGEPIHVRDWQAAYAEDKVAAVNDLTAHLEAANRALILHTTDDEQDQLLYRLERIWQNDQPLPVEKHYSRTRQLLRGLQQLQATQPETYTRLRQQAAYYAGALRQHQLTDRGLANATKRLWTPAAVLGFPFWLYGRLNHLFIYALPRWLEQQLGLYEGYAATVKIIAGTILTPFFYVLQYQLINSWLPQPWPLLYLLSLPLSAYFAWQYDRYLQPRREADRWLQWQEAHQADAEQLLAQRQALKTMSTTWLA